MRRTQPQRAQANIERTNIIIIKKQKTTKPESRSFVDMTYESTHMIKHDIHDV